VRGAGNRELDLPLAGYVHDTAVAPGYMEGMVYAYATPAVAARLGFNAEPDHLVFIAEDRGVAARAGAVSAALRQAGAEVLRTEIYPNVHPHAGLMAALLQIFRGIALMVFVCSSALAAFLISLWMRREARQIGIMKTIGARSHQIALQYLALVGPVLLACAALALWLGTAAGDALIVYTAAEQNIDLFRRGVPGSVVGLEIALGLGLPLLAVALPVVLAARRTARAAIQDPGIAAPGAGSRFARALVRSGDRRTTFALRNTFRRPWRLAFTVLGLAMGGATLLTSANHYESLMRLIDETVLGRDHDFEVGFPRPLAPAQLEAAVRGVPGIAVAEAWRRSAVDLVDPALPENERRIQISGSPVNSRLVKPPIQEGRWPEPGETGVTVVSRPLTKRAGAVKVGSSIAVQSRQGRTELKVVGMIDEINVSAVYVDAVAFESITGIRGLAPELRVKIAPGAALDTVVADVDRALVEQKLSFSPIVTRRQIRQNYAEHFRNFLGVLSIAALAVASVGAMCLVAFAGLNVLERAREIGVIRTLGASPGGVLRLFMAESGSVALLGLGLAVLLAVPATFIFNNFTSGFFLLPVHFEVSWLALGALVLGLPVVLGGVWLTVSRLLRLSVRETLAYE
jgi:putative ABC transport system permease protein